MLSPTRLCWAAVLSTSFLAGFLWLTLPLQAATPGQADPTRLQYAFEAAAQEFGVPLNVLLALSYNESRWEHHGGQPSFAGGYGIMHLTDLTGLEVQRKGASSTRSFKPDPKDPAWRTLLTAASLLKLNPDLLKTDPAQNIRGGAALLAQYARETTGSAPATAGDWYGAVARYSESQEADIALDFADLVYATLNEGASHTTSEGQQVTLAPQKVTPNKSTADALQLRGSRRTPADCPSGLACKFIPAAYQLNNPDDLSDYGNYDLANRARDRLDIKYIVIHDTEIPYNTTIDLFQNSYAYVSSHYVIRSSDGQIAQMVENENVAWHAGNWYVNMHSIGFEHEGVAIEGASWYTERMYRSAARLARYLADKYGIPLDRAHIVGHDELPGPTAGFQTTMHWDPGPFWDWAHYMALMGAPITPDDNHNNGLGTITINPNFATNRPPLTYCYSETDCRGVPRQSANFVYLHTAPSFDAPLLDDPALPGPGTTRAPDWGDKAATGQQFYRAERQGDWDAIYFGGQTGWFHNPRGANAVSGRAILVTPKAGRASIPVYGRAYPEAEAYQAEVPVQPILPLQYSIPAGQIYVAADRVRADYFYAPTYALDPADHSVVEGQTEYYQIYFNHRFAFVRVSDVQVVGTR